MCIFVEIPMAVFAVIVWLKGRLRVTARRAVTGLPARLISLVLMVPLPFNLATIGVVSALRGQAPRTAEAAIASALALELTVTLSALGLTLVLAVVFARKVAPSSDKERSFTPNAEDATRPDPDNPYAPPGTPLPPKR